MSIFSLGFLINSMTNFLSNWLVLGNIGATVTSKVEALITQITMPATAIGVLFLIAASFLLIFGGRENQEKSKKWFIGIFLGLAIIWLARLLVEGFKSGVQF